MTYNEPIVWYEYTFDGAKLAPVIEVSRLVKGLGVHVEVVNLIIPNHNDSTDELRELSCWIYKNLGRAYPSSFQQLPPPLQDEESPSSACCNPGQACSVAIEEEVQFVYNRQCTGAPP